MDSIKELLELGTIAALFFLLAAVFADDIEYGIRAFMRWFRGEW